MAFTLDPTVGGAESNSYVTLAEADEYFESHLDGETWRTTPSRKAAALAQATRRLNRETFAGQKTNVVQRLQFPRTNLLSRNVYGLTDRVNTFSGGYTFLDPNEIPLELKEATFEMALYYLKQSDGEFTADDNDLETLNRMKVGPLDLDFRATKGDRLPTRVKDLLRAIGPNAWNGNDGIRFTA